MVSTLDVGTNTYVELAEADTYLGDMIGADAWGFLDEDTKNKALLTAFKILQKQMWGGTKTDPLQVPDFPRTGLTCNGEEVDPDEVPEDMKSAQIELAFYVSQTPGFLSQANTGGNVRRLGAGSASIEYFNSTDGSSGGPAASRFPPSIQELIQCFFGSSAAAGAEAFGTGCASIFPCCDNDAFDRNLPL